MGEAQWRRNREGPAIPDAEVVQRVRDVSLPSGGVDGLDSVQVLIFKLTSVEQVKEALGGLPLACLRHLREIQSSPQVQALADGLLWECWPDGRQLVQTCTSVDAFLDVFDAFYCCAMERGYGVRLAAFPEGNWPQRLKSVADKFRDELVQVAQAIDRAPAIRRERLRPDVLVLYVPKLADHAARRAVDAKLLRVFDELGATKASLMTNRGAVRLVFEGYDEDHREVWEFEPVRQTLNAVHLLAPWWPWLVGPEQFVIWLGALAAESITEVAKERGELTVAFEISEDALKKLAQEFVTGCGSALLVAGVDGGSPSFTAFVKRQFGALGESARVIHARSKDLQLGFTQRASAEERLKFLKGSGGASGPRTGRPF